MSKYNKFLLWVTGLLTIMWMVSSSAIAQVSPPPQNPQSGSVGLQGKISAPPPTVGATISLPRDGQSFTSLPVTVSGLCSADLLVKLFKNNVFAGSVQCKNGSYSIIIDLFSGQNELIARVYDALDQAGPDSNKVIVSFNDNRAGSGSRVSMTSNFAKRGANPGQTLTWPIILSGGTGPYAVSVDWGDNKAPDLVSQQFPGTFNIQHVYDAAGVYNIVIKVSDKNGDVAFLQLVGVANGPLSQEQATGGTQNGNGPTIIKTKPGGYNVVLLLPLMFFAFWLGKKYELKVLKRRIERGDRPF